MSSGIGNQERDDRIAFLRHQKREIDAELDALTGEPVAGESTYAALKQRCEALEAFFAAFPGILNLEDDQFRYVATDATTPTYFGLTPSSIVGKAVEDLSPEFIRDFGPMMRLVIDTGTPEMNMPVQAPVPARAGNLTRWLASYFPVPLPSGERGIGIVGVEVPDAAEAIEQSEERFRSVLDSSRDCIYRCNLQTGRYEYLSPSAERILGRRPEPLGGAAEAAFALVHPDDLPQLQAALTLSVVTGHADAEYRRRTVGGEYRWLSSHMSVTKGPDGEPLYRDGSVRDITERKRADAELERRAAELAAAVSAVADGLVVYDAGGRISHASKAAERLLGLTPASAEALADERLERYDIVTLEGHHIAVEQMPTYRALAFGESVSGVVMGIRRGASVTWLSGSAAPIRTSAGSQVGAVASFTDITDQENARATLEQLLTDRAEFMATCAHELKTPLTVLLANIELFQHMFDSLDGSRRNGFLASMSNQAKKLDRLVTDLLDVSRIESGHLTIHPEPAELHDLVARIIADFTTTCQTHTVLAPTPPECVADVDKGRFEQMLLNLLTNAAKYSAEGATIAIGMEVHDAHVEISVTDEGYGIPKGDIPKLFERYYRHPATGAASGLGIGLYVTMELAHLHGGAVEVQSTAGKGSTFTLRLPVSARSRVPA